MSELFKMILCTVLIGFILGTFLGVMLAIILDLLDICDEWLQRLAGTWFVVMAVVVMFSITYLCIAGLVAIWS